MIDMCIFLAHTSICCPDMVLNEFTVQQKSNLKVYKRTCVLVQKSVPDAKATIAIAHHNKMAWVQHNKMGLNRTRLRIFSPIPEESLVKKPTDLTPNS